MADCRTFGRYRAAQRIGCGGTSEIWAAYLETDAGFRKKVAIKSLLPGFCESEEIRELMQDEARVLTHLSHNAIVSVLDYGCEGSVPYIAMEYVDGIDCALLLGRLMDGGRKLPPEYALYIIDQVLLALDFAHRCTGDDGLALGVIHRDVSPSNILISWNGEVKVADFGIARGAHRTRLTQAGRVRGKYSYMSPEQARGEEIDERADLFACAVILFELVAGRRLFDAESDLVVLERVRNLDVPWEAIEDLPAAVRAILMVEFANDVNARFESASEMLMDVRAAERNAGNPVSSIEMSAYLAGEFGRGSGSGRQAGLFMGRDGLFPATAVAPCFGVCGAGLMVSVLRVAAALLCLLLFMSASKGERREREGPEVRSGASVTAAGPATGPVLPGAIAVNTNPPGADAAVEIGGERRRVRTPFAVEGLDVEGAVNCRIRISKAGFRDIAEDFVLTPGAAQYVKNFTLEKVKGGSLMINAEPWGTVSVSGHMQARETPLRIPSIAPGAYDVTVEYPPERKRLSVKAVVPEGGTLRCLASFISDTFSCR